MRVEQKIGNRKEKKKLVISRDAEVHQILYGENIRNSNENVINVQTK